MQKWSIFSDMVSGSRYIGACQTYVYQRNDVDGGIFRIMPLYVHNSLQWITGLICTVEWCDLQEAFLLNDDDFNHLFLEIR